MGLVGRDPGLRGGLVNAQQWHVGDWKSAVSLERLEEGDGVFDFGDGVGRVAAFDGDPAAVVEFGETAEEFGEVGRAAAELDFDALASRKIADSVAGVYVQHVFAKCFDRLLRRVAGHDQSAGVQVDANELLGQCGEQPGEIGGRRIGGLQGRADAEAIAIGAERCEGLNHSIECGCICFGGYLAGAKDDYVGAQIGGESHRFLRGTDAAVQVIGHVETTTGREGNRRDTKIAVAEQLVDIA